MDYTLPVKVFRQPKNAHFYFSVPGLWEIHKNLKQKQSFNFGSPFLENTFLYIFLHKSWIWRLWDMLWIFSLIAIFIMLLKNAFGPKKYQISCPRSKLPFWQFLFFFKVHFWTRAWNLKIILTKTFFWSIMNIAIRKNIHNTSQGPTHPGFMHEKVQKGDFKKSAHENWSFLSVLGPYEFLEGLKD